MQSGGTPRETTQEELEQFQREFNGMRPQGGTKRKKSPNELRECNISGEEPPMKRQKISPTNAVKSNKKKIRKIATHSVHSAHSAQEYVRLTADGMVVFDMRSKSEVVIKNCGCNLKTRVFDPYNANLDEKARFTCVRSDNFFIVIREKDINKETGVVNLTDPATRQEIATASQWIKKHYQLEKSNMLGEDREAVLNNAIQKLSKQKRNHYNLVSLRSSQKRREKRFQGHVSDPVEQKASSSQPMRQASTPGQPGPSHSGMFARRLPSPAVIQTPAAQMQDAVSGSSSSSSAAAQNTQLPQLQPPPPLLIQGGASLSMTALALLNSSGAAASPPPPNLPLDDEGVDPQFTLSEEGVALSLATMFRKDPNARRESSSAAMQTTAKP